MKAHHLTTRQLKRKIMLRPVLPWKRRWFSWVWQELIWRTYNRNTRRIRVKIRALRHIAPPEGYRFLRDGEIIQLGDLVPAYGKLPWVEAQSIGDAWVAGRLFPMCRKISQQPNP